MSATAPSRVAPVSATPFPTLLVATLAASVLLSSLDAFITFVATPAIERDLRAGDAEAQLLIGAYIVVFASLLVTGARIGERVGVRDAYRAGMAGFATASLLCALAPTPGVLLAGRALQGVGAAVMAPQALAAIRLLVPAAHRARAMSWVGVLGGAGATVGQLLGGALVSLDVAGSSWRGCFLVNLPIAAVAFVLAGRVVPRTPRTPVRFDALGVALSVAGFGLLVLAATQGREQGWPAWALASLVAGPLLLVGLARHEAALERRGGAPLLAPSLLREPGFATAALAVALLFTTAAGYYLPVALLFQQGLGLTPVAAGAAFVPFGLAFYLGSLLSHRFVRDGERRGALLAVATMLAGLALLAALLLAFGIDTPPEAIGAAGAISGLGQGALTGSLIGRAMSRAPADLAGAAAGATSTLQQLGNAAGVAVVGGVLFSVAGAHAASNPTAIVHGFLAAIGVVAVAVAGLGAFLARS